jgi:hypothetical protein
VCAKRVSIFLVVSDAETSKLWMETVDWIGCEYIINSYDGQNEALSGSWLIDSEKKPFSS